MAINQSNIFMFRLWWPRGRHYQRTGQQTEVQTRDRDRWEGKQVSVQQHVQRLFTSEVSVMRGFSSQGEFKIGHFLSQLQAWSAGAGGCQSSAPGERGELLNKTPVCGQILKLFQSSQGNQRSLYFIHHDKCIVTIFKIIFYHLLHPTSIKMFTPIHTILEINFFSEWFRCRGRTTRTAAACTR